MVLIVEKFGGTSVGTVERIQIVANGIAERTASGEKLVVVVSAMSGETNRLLDLAKEINPQPNPRELDVLVTTGEQVTIALLAMALHQLGVGAVSYTGFQVPIVTDSVHGKARIENINCDRIHSDLGNNNVVIVAGFQGISTQNNITALGRGGSDTTAVAVAAALKADECRIYTDVDGVYTADPRVVDDARCLHYVTFEEMLELSGAGAKVLQVRSVELAGKYAVPLRVLSSFEEDGAGGTLITHEEESMENPYITGITSVDNEAKVMVKSIADRPGIASTILGKIADANINVDMIIQNISSDGLTDITFTVNQEDMNQCITLLKPVVSELDGEGVFGDGNLSKISVIGVGMRSNAGVASKMFQSLAEKGINIQMISTSEIRISVTVDKEYSELAVRALHKTFGLEKVQSDII